VSRLLRLNARWWQAATAVLLVAITVLSLLPTGAPDIPLARNDKVQHLIAYGALALPAALARPRFWPLLLGGFALWSGAIEIVQPHVGRAMHLADFAANLAGLALGAALAALLRRAAAN